MYAQHVRKWSLKTKQRMQFTKAFTFCLCTMLLRTTVAAAAAAAATTTATGNAALHRQRSSLAEAGAGAGAGAGVGVGAATLQEEEQSYYIAIGEDRSGEAATAAAAAAAAAAADGSAVEVGDGHLISNSHINLKPTTVFAASAPKTPLINSQIFKLLNNQNSNSHHPSRQEPQLQLQLQQQLQFQLQLQPQAHQHNSNNEEPARSFSRRLTARAAVQPAAAAASSSSLTSAASADWPAASQHFGSSYNNISSSSSSSSSYTTEPSEPTQRYLIEAYEVPESLPGGNDGVLTQEQRQWLQQVPRNRRENNNQLEFQQPHGMRQLQQQQQQPQQRRARRRQQGRRTGHRERGRGQRLGRYCSARDPGQLAFEAPTVFEGKITSMTSDRRVNFSVTMKVLKIYKQQPNFQMPESVRLQFTLSNSSGECDIYRERLLPRGLVRADDLEQGVVYMTFVQQTDLSNFTILGKPKRSKRPVVNAVTEAVSEKYGQFASIISIKTSNKSMEHGKTLLITCKVEGQPPPTVTWFKEGKSIRRKRDLYQFKHYKRRSELIIRSFNSSDAGVYECRAKNKVRKRTEKKRIIITAYAVPTRNDVMRPKTDLPCPADASSFCLNKGSCKLIPALTQYYCICPDGFIGERCENKASSRPDKTTFKTGYIADDPSSYHHREGRSMWMM